MYVCVQVKVCVLCVRVRVCARHDWPMYFTWFFLLRKCGCRQCVLFTYEGCSASIVYVLAYIS
jgi:hypothetical protein